MSNNHLRYVSTDRIFAKLHRDLKGVNLNESDIIEWIGEALDSLQVFGLAEEVVKFVEVKNHDIAFPERMYQIQQIAKHVSWCPDDNMVTCPPDLPDYPSITDCNGNLVFDTTQVNNNGAFALDYESWTNCEYFTENFVPVRLSTHSMFKSVVCKQNEQTPIYKSCVHEYTLIGSVNKRIRFSFRNGLIAISYTRHRVDLVTGYPLIPDNYAWQSAITYYVKWKISQWHSWNGREGAARLAQDAERLWLRYSLQAKNYMKMPKTADEYQNYREQNNHLIPRRNQYYGFFGNLGREEIKEYTQPFRKRGFVPELVSGGCDNCDETKVQTILSVSTQTAEANEELSNIVALYTVERVSTTSPINIDLNIDLIGQGSNPVSTSDISLEYFDGTLWQSVSNPVTFTSTETQLPFRVLAVDDLFVEGTEGFEITVSTNQADVIINNNVVTGSITETDSNHISILDTNPVNNVASEDGTKTATFELKKVSGDLTASVTVNISLNGIGLNPISSGEVVFESFENGAWVSVGGTLTLSSTEVVKQLRVIAIDDNIIEATEDFEIVISNPTNNFIIDNNSVLGVVESNDVMAFISLHFSGNFAGKNQQISFSEKIVGLQIVNFHNMTSSYTVKYSDTLIPPDWSLITAQSITDIQLAIDTGSDNYLLYFEVQSYNNTFLTSVLTLSYTSTNPITNLQYLSVNQVSQSVMIGLPAGKTYQLNSITSGNGLASNFYFEVIYNGLVDDLTLYTKDLTQLNTELLINTSEKIVQVYFEYRGTNTTEDINFEWLIN